jgi:TetR/AcrR family transcriptional regulator, transcriptional repressor for nem operon
MKNRYAKVDKKCEEQNMTDAPRSYVAWLKDGSRTHPPLRKGDRSRLGIMVAAADLFEQHNYDEVLIGDIMSLAGMAEGSFYTYFTDKAAVTLSILTNMFEDFLPLHLKQPEIATDLSTSIRWINRMWMRVCRANPGLLRCALRLSDYDPAYANLLQNVTEHFYIDIARQVSSGEHKTGPAQPMLTIYLLGGMVGYVMRRTILYPEDSFAHLLDQNGLTAEDAADAMSDIWISVLVDNI